MGDHPVRYTARLVFAEVGLKNDSGRQGIMKGHLSAPLSRPNFGGIRGHMEKPSPLAQTGNDLGRGLPTLGCDVQSDRDKFRNGGPENDGGGDRIAPDVPFATHAPDAPLKKTTHPHQPFEQFRRFRVERKEHSDIRQRTNGQKGDLPRMGMDLLPKEGDRRIGRKVIRRTVRMVSEDGGLVAFRLDGAEYRCGWPPVK